MESPEVLPERTFRLQLNRAHVIEAMLDARENERKCASPMRQHNLESREFVESSSSNELDGRGGVFEREANQLVTLGGPTRRLL